MSELFVPRFSWMKTKYQNYMREDHYFDILLQSDLSMFTYENLPAGLDPVWIEKYLNIGGSIGITRTPETYVPELLPDAPEYRPKYCVCPIPSRDGNVDQYGDGSHLAGSTANVSMEGDLGIDAVIIYNRDTRLPELDNMIDADALMQIDKSAAINVILSRIAPIFSCYNDKSKKALDTMLDEILDGKLKTIVSGDVKDLLKMGIDGGTEILEITHPEKIQYIQYLSQYYDVIIRRHYNRRGLSVRTGTKAAQQSADEIHGLDAVSWIIPLAKLESRRRGFEQFNAIFGENVSVRFSEIWQQEYDAYKLRMQQQDTAAEKEEDAAEDAADPDPDPEETGGGVSDDPETET